MALRLTLKPNERLIIGGAVVKNGKARTELVVENEVPILRERDILSPQAATTPCRRIYLAIQLMYVDPERLAQHCTAYFQLVRDVAEAAPSTLKFIAPMNDDIVGGRYYQALKNARHLVDYEQELLSYGEERA
jgi:flagellar protein FlbT